MMFVRQPALVAPFLAVAAFVVVFRHAESAEGEPVLERCLVSLVEEAQVPAREAGVLVELQIREGDVVSAVI